VPRRTNEQVEQRLRDVEHALLTHPWTMNLQLTLAATHDVSDRQIRRDAATIRARWSEDAQSTDKDAAKIDWLQRVRMAQHKADSEGHSIAHSRLLALEARTMGFESPVQVQVQHTVEDLDPVSQARAIVEYYPDAVRLLQVAGDSTVNAIDVDYTDGDE
tara:strand:+ start:604 stop:1083 length:480 start_codon:yes stop_codon:yes gene_type:complete